MQFQIRIDATTLPSLIFGGLLIIVAFGLGVYAWRARRALQPILENDDQAQFHANGQFRRRIQVSIMLAAVGILIPLGDQLDRLFVRRPQLFLVWVLCVLVLVIWLVLMALGDWLSTVTFSSITKSKLRYERRVLEEEIRRYHASKNGNSPKDGPDSFTSGASP